MVPTAVANHKAGRVGTSVSSGPLAGVVRSRRSSDVEETNSGGADVEIVVVELGFYDHVTAETYKHEPVTLKSTDGDRLANLHRRKRRAETEK